jgi:signal transduction histidine kinase
MNPPTTEANADREEATFRGAVSRPGDLDFRAVLDAIGVRISVTDGNDCLVFQNRAERETYEALGIDTSRLIGLKRVDVNSTLLDAGIIDRPHFDQLDQPNPEVVIEGVDRLYISIRRFPLPDGGVAVVNDDETDARRSEQALAEEQRLATVGSLVAGIAHEINTPLGVAVTAASFLRDAIARMHASVRTGALSGVEAERMLSAFAEAIALIRSNLDRTTNLVRGVKQLSVDPAGDDRQRVRIRRVVSGTAVTLMPEARRRGHALLVDCPTDLEVMTCPRALSQVVANLVMNCLHHAFERPGGTILVTVTCHARHLRIIVGDDGIGVEPEARRRLFEPFFTTRRTHGGLGLGLSVVQSVVQRRLGGTIETEGAPGEGLRQIVTIPLA